MRRRSGPCEWQRIPKPRSARLERLQPVRLFYLRQSTQAASQIATASTISGGIRRGDTRSSFLNKNRPESWSSHRHEIQSNRNGMRLTLCAGGRQMRLTFRVMPGDQAGRTRFPFQKGLLQV
jgi:hypothetical protein